MLVPCEQIACVAWRFWLGALSNKGGRGQRNCEEIGAGAANFAATPLLALRPARQNRHATQASEQTPFRGVARSHERAARDSDARASVLSQLPWPATIGELVIRLYSFLMFILPLEMHSIHMSNTQPQTT